MAPEQAGSRASAGGKPAVGPASDVYSLGAILYHMLTGRPPFQAATPVETILLALEHDPIPPRALNPRVSPDLEMIALKCLQKSPALRYPTAEALADDLDAFLRGDPVSARSTSLRALAARLLGETHHAPIARELGAALDLSTASRCSSSSARPTGSTLAGVTARWPYVLIFTVGLCGWAAIFWALRRRGGPIRFVERQLAHVWGAGIVAINLIFLVEWLLGLPVLSLVADDRRDQRHAVHDQGRHPLRRLLPPGRLDVPDDLPDGGVSRVRPAHLRRGRLGLLLRHGPEIPAPQPSIDVSGVIGGDLDVPEPFPTGRIAFMTIRLQEQRQDHGPLRHGRHVVTTDGEAGSHGMTANAVASLSLDPPLVLVAVEKRAAFARVSSKGTAASP